jgi:DNA (cytosine-5)-methyltransferase 1
MSAPVLIDVCSKAGGAAMGYRRAGFEVICLDIEPQPNCPFEFVQADITTFDLGALVRDTGAVALHGSPPCQLFCAYRRRGSGVGDSYLNLIPDVREMFEVTGLPWIIENVPGARAELKDPVQLCGSSFGLDVRRHRLFESNIGLTTPPCDHAWQTPRFTPASNRTNLRSTVEIGVYRIPLAVQRAAMGIDWMTLGELSEAIPPAYTEHLGRQVLAQLEAVAA